MRSVPDSWYVVPSPSGAVAAACGPGGATPKTCWATASIVASINVIASLSWLLRTMLTFARGTRYSSRSGGVGIVTALLGRLGSISPTARIDTSSCAGGVCENSRTLSRSGTLWNSSESERPPPCAPGGTADAVICRWKWTGVPSPRLARQRTSRAESSWSVMASPAGSGTVKLTFLRRCTIRLAPIWLPFGTPGTLTSASRALSIAPAASTTTGRRLPLPAIVPLRSSGPSPVSMPITSCTVLPVARM